MDHRNVYTSLGYWNQYPVTVNALAIDSCRLSPLFLFPLHFFSHLTTRLIGFSFQRVISWPFPPWLHKFISASHLNTLCLDFHQANMFPVSTHGVSCRSTLSPSVCLVIISTAWDIQHIIHFSTHFMNFLTVCACINCMCALVFVCMLQIESIYILYFSSFLSILAGLCFYVFIAHGYLTYKLKHNAVNFLYSFRSSWKISCFRKKTSLLVSKDATNESTTH